MAIFYWSIFRADLMTMAGAFLIGLVLDLLSGGPVGLNAMMLLLAHQPGVSQRRVFLGSSFLVTGVAFAMVVSAVTLTAWTMTRMLNWTPLPVAPLRPDWAPSRACNPPVSCVISRIARR